MPCRPSQELLPLASPLGATTAIDVRPVQIGDDTHLLVNSGDDDAIV